MLGEGEDRRASGVCVVVLGCHWWGMEGGKCATRTKKCSMVCRFIISITQQPCIHQHLY